MSENRAEKFWKSCPKLVHQDEIETLTNLTRQRLWQMQKEGIIVAADRGWYPFVQVVQQIVRYYRTRLDDKSAKASSRARQEEADAVLAEMEVKQKLEEVVDVEVMAERMRQPMEAMRKLILSSGLETDEKDDLLSNLTELYGNIFGDEIKSPKLLKFVKDNKIKLNTK